MPPDATSNFPGCLPLRPRERALLVAEQLALEERLRDRPAVHRHERGGGPGAGLVDCPGHELLASSGLARDHHREVGTGDSAPRPR